MPAEQKRGIEIKMGCCLAFEPLSPWGLNLLKWETVAQLGFSEEQFSHFMAQKSWVGKLKDINILIYFVFGFSSTWWETYPLISVSPEDKVREGPLIECIWKASSIQHPYLA